MDTQRIERRLVEQTREGVLLNRTNVTAIADQCGLNRNTVSRNLGLRDTPPTGPISLGLWLAATQLSGLDPVSMLNQAIQDDAKHPDAAIAQTMGSQALADGGVR